MYHFLSIIAMFLLLLNEDSAYALRPINEDLLSSKVVFSEQSHPKFMELVKKIVIDINKNQVGETLLKVIKERLTDVKKIDYLVVEETTGSTQNTAFHHGLDFDLNKEIPEDLREKIGGKLHLYINLDNAVSCYIPSEKCESLFADAECLYGPKMETGQLSYYRVANIYSPFYVTIAHEFIHLKHFLDDCIKKSEVMLPCGHAALIREYRDVEKYSDLKSLPELSELDMFSSYSKGKNVLNKLRRIIPWDNFEERRTVCGPDVDGISEMTFRLAEGLPIRYIYQGNHYFLEESSVAEQIVKANLDDCRSKFGLDISMDSVFESLPHGLQTFEDRMKRSEEEGLVYSPLIIKLAFLSDDKIIERVFPFIRAGNKDIIKKALKSLRKHMGQESEEDM